MWLQQVGGFKPGSYVDQISVDLAVGSVTHTISSLPFQPSSCICLGAISGGNAAVSLGFAAINDVIGSSQGCVYNNHNAVAAQWLTNPNYLGMLVMSAGNVGYWHSLVYGPSSLTFTYDKTGTPTGTAVLNFMINK